MRVRAKSSCLLVLLLVAVVCHGRAAAVDISMAGTWSVNIGSADLVAGVGSNLPDAWESETNQGVLAITNTTGDTDNWRVDISRSDANWPAALTIYVRRTSDGVGLGGSISGGLAYQAVDVDSSAFFSGSGDRTGVDVQLKVTGVSLAIQPNAYSTSIVYTVVDVP